MNKFVLPFFFLWLSETTAFAVKIDIEGVSYHTDCKGGVKSVKEIDGNSVTISYFDVDGRFLHRDQLVDGKLNTISSMKYDKMGNPVEYKEDGDVTILKYNKQNLLCAIEKYEEGGIKVVAEKLYTPQGLDYRLLLFKSTGEYDVMGEFAYGNNGKVTELRSYKFYRNGWRKTGLIKKEYSQNKILKAEYWYDFKWDSIPELRGKKFFNNDGKVLMELRCNSDGVVYDSTVYAYDQLGNLTKKYRTNAKGREVLLTKTYKYDKYGNPTEISSVSESDFDYSSVVKYEYEYYPQANTKKSKPSFKVLGYGPTAKLEQNENWNLSFKTLADLAAKGNKDAQCRLAFYYKTGTATEVNYRKAAELYRAAAEKGSAEAQFSLGECFLMGSGVRQSLDDAGKWFALAADKGYEKACYDAGICLQARERRAVSENALEYFKKSAATGYLPAKRILQTVEDYKNKQAEKETVKNQAGAARKSMPKVEEAVEAVAADYAPSLKVTEEESVKDDDYIAYKVEEKASYVGGKTAFMEYLRKNMIYPKKALDANIQGSVILTFIVNKDGSISDIRVVRSVDPDIDKEAVRLVKGMKNWNPGKVHNKPVRSKYTLPILFKIDAQ